MTAKNNKRIETLKKIILDLQAEKQQLTKENQKLQSLLDEESSKTEQGLEEIEGLKVELKKTINEYQELSCSLWEVKTKYEKQVKELSELKAKYKTNMDKTMKSIRKSFI